MEERGVVLDGANGAPYQAFKLCADVVDGIMWRYVQWSRLADELCEWILDCTITCRPGLRRQAGLSCRATSQVAADVPTVFHSWGRYKKVVDGVGALDELSLCDQL